MSKFAARRIATVIENWQTAQAAIAGERWADAQVATIETINELHALMDELQRLRRPSRWAPCDGSANCQASEHIHGCFAERPRPDVTAGEDR